MGTRGPAPGPWGPAPASSAAPDSAPPPLRSILQRRRCAPLPRFPRRCTSSRSHIWVQRLRRAPWRTGLEWSSRPPRLPRTRALSAGRVPLAERPSGTRWPRGWCPPRPARQPPRGVKGLPVVRSPHPGYPNPGYPPGRQLSPPRGPPEGSPPHSGRWSPRRAHTGGYHTPS